MLRYLWMVIDKGIAHAPHRLGKTRAQRVPESTAWALVHDWHGSLYTPLEARMIVRWDNGLGPATLTIPLSWERFYGKGTQEKEA